MTTAKAADGKGVSAGRNPESVAPKRSSAAKATSAKNSPSTKAPATKTTSKKAGRSGAKKAPAKSSGERKYSPAASKDVEREMHAMKQGKLKSGGNGKKVTNPKQAIAIALSEARRSGKKVPPNPNQ